MRSLMSAFRCSNSSNVFQSRMKEIRLGATSFALLVLGVIAFTIAHGQTELPRTISVSNSLVTIVRQELLVDSALSRKRVWVTNRILRVDLSPVMPIALIPSSDRYGLQMEAMMRAIALQRDFANSFGSGQNEFWRAPLFAVEADARKSIDRGGTSSEADRIAFDSAIDTQMDRLWSLTVTAAEKRKLDVQGTRDAAPGFEVHIQINPSDARIRIMPFLTYKECLVLRTSLEDQWTELNEGKHLHIGRYRYVAAWGKQGGGAEEGTFEVKADGVITFQPPRSSTQNAK